MIYIYKYIIIYITWDEMSGSHHFWQRSQAVRGTFLDSWIWGMFLFLGFIGNDDSQLLPGISNCLNRDDMGGS